MKDKILKAIFILTIAFMLYIFFAPYIMAELISLSLGHTTATEIMFSNFKEYMDSTIHTRKYNTKIDEYIIKRFGEEFSKKLKIVKNNGKNYVAKCDELMDSKFTIYYVPDGDYCNDDFDERIVSDQKFQHLYSEWVKKQVGIDDENVEFGFTGNFETPYIEFDKITTLSEDYREVFENTHNLYLDIINIEKKDINEKNYIDYFNKIKNEIYLKCYHVTGKPDKPYSLFIYVDDYRFIYNYPEEELVSIKKGKERIELQ